MFLVYRYTHEYRENIPRAITRRPADLNALHSLIVTVDSHLSYGFQYSQYHDRSADAQCGRSDVQGLKKVQKVRKNRFF